MPHGLIFPAAVPQLCGERVLLRELSERDIPAWYARATDAEAADLAGDPVPASIDEGTAWLERHRERFRKRTAIRWAIALRTEPETIGTVGLTITSDEKPLGQLGIVIGRAYWGRGVGTSAALLAARYGFDVLGLKELRAEVLQRNLSSVRLLDKVGFQLVRTVSAKEAADGEACFHYGLRGPSRGAA
jgi:ribosomal-protein-alanine N-acetyltransferase